MAQTPCLPGWSENYDYVMVMAASAAGDLSGFIPDQLRLLYQADAAAIFKVRL